MQILLSHDLKVISAHGDGAVVNAPTGCLILPVPDGTPVEIGQAWEVTVDEAVAARVKEAASACSAVLAPLRARFSDGEELTWKAQLDEARAILADPDLPESDYPTIAGIIAETHEDKGTFAMAVVANNEAWTAATASAIGQRQAIVARIKACQTVADVLAADMTITLPTGG
jgi:hypothetical protein